MVHGSRTIIHADALRATVIALRAGQSLAEHAAPPAATLLIIRGQVVLSSGDRRWQLRDGQHITIPTERHALDAVTDAVVLLTVRPE